MTLIKVLLSVLYQLNKLVRLKVVTLEEKFPYMIFNEIRLIIKIGNILLIYTKSIKRFGECFLRMAP